MKKAMKRALLLALAVAMLVCLSACGKCAWKIKINGKDIQIPCTLDDIGEVYSLDRQKLGEIVFSDKNKLQMLNDTIYPFINKLIDEKINATESEFVLLDAPTLFEAGADKLCSVIVSVVADFGIRLERITKRDGISAELAKKRFSSQHTMEFFKAHSDFVIENNGSVNDTFQKTCEVIETIKERYNGG